MEHLINILLSKDCLLSVDLVVNFLLNSATEEESCRLIIINCVSDNIYFACLFGKYKFFMDFRRSFCCL